jgi:hypothetical protein
MIRHPLYLDGLESQVFTLGEVLTALTGVMLCPIDDVYKVLNFLTGESLYTHQLPRAFRVCQPFVAQQHPDLAALDWSGVGPTTWRAWLDARVERFGPTRALSPMPAGMYERQDPIAEAAEMMGGNASARLIVIKTS